MAGARRRPIVSDGGKFHIEGLADFADALEYVRKGYPETLSKATTKLAKEVVKRAKLTARAESRLANKAAKSLRASGAGSSASIRGGGPDWPFFYGAEFGAKQYRQFKEWRGNQWEGWDGGPGYFLHPTIRHDAKDLIEQYLDTLDELHREAFPL